LASRKAQNFELALDEIEIFFDLNSKERGSISKLCSWPRAKSGEKIVGP
jgi:hypothetical protein